MQRRPRTSAPDWFAPRSPRSRPARSPSPRSPVPARARPCRVSHRARSARSARSTRRRAPVEITMWHSMPRANEDDAPAACRQVQLVAERGEGHPRRPDHVPGHARQVRRRALDRRPPRPRADRGRRRPADDRHAVGAAGAGVREGRQVRPRPVTSSGSSTTTRSTRRSGRCRSTCPARSSTTTRTRSGGRPRPRLSRRRRSTRSRPTRRRSSTAGVAPAGYGLKIEPWLPRAVPRPRPASST